MKTMTIEETAKAKKTLETILSISLLLTKYSPISQLGHDKLSQKDIGCLLIVNSQLYQIIVAIEYDVLTENI
jgi:hypothetical protein